MRGDEVDRRVRTAACQRVQIRAARQSIGKLAEDLIGAAPVIADRIAILAVPLRPQRREIADLISAFADVPRFRDQLHLRQHRILLNDVEERAEPIDVVQLAGERRGQIESEAVHMHLHVPIAQ